jgi:hypothetical protein
MRRTGFPVSGACQRFLSNPALEGEIFGPTSLLVVATMKRRCWPWPSTWKAS